MKTLLDRYLGLVVFSGLIVILDQVTKFLVRNDLPLGAVWAPWSWLMPYARVYHTQNTGMAFSILPGFSWLFILFAVGVSLGILYYFPRVSKREWLIRLGMILLLGGALGNLIDRLTIGQVTDFISVGTFAVFNVADACIDTGAVALLIGMTLSERREKKRE